MNIKAIIIGIVVLAVLGGGAYVVTNKNDNKSPATQSSSQNVKEPTSLNSLLAQNKNVQCSYSSTDDTGNKSSGTSYISNKRMRGSFTVQTSGQPEIKSNIVSDGTYSYIWNDGSKTGFKTKVSADDSDSTDDQTNQSQQSIDQDQKYDFDCSDWSVDESMFTPPSDVSFTDFSAQLEQSQNANGIQQAACAQITDAATREACEQAL